jgi:hypothetical protein
MTLSEAIGILRLHQKWRKGTETLMIIPEILSEAFETIIELTDPKLLEGTTPNAWDLYFIRKLQIEIGKLPYQQGLDDGGFNDGLTQGFEQGAQWVWDNFKLEVK